MLDRLVPVVVVSTRALAWLSLEAAERHAAAGLVRYLAPLPDMRYATYRPLELADTWQGGRFWPARLH